MTCGLPISSPQFRQHPHIRAVNTFYSISAKPFRTLLSGRRSMTDGAGLLGMSESYTGLLLPACTPSCTKGSNTGRNIHGRGFSFLSGVCWPGPQTGRCGGGGVRSQDNRNVFPLSAGDQKCETESVCRADALWRFLGRVCPPCRPCGIRVASEATCVFSHFPGAPMTSTP